MVGRVEQNGGRISELSQLVISSCFFCHDSYLGQGRGHSGPRGWTFSCRNWCKDGLIRAGSGAQLSGGDPEQRKGQIQSGGDDLETYF